MGNQAGSLDDQASSHGSMVSAQGKLLLTETTKESGSSRTILAPPAESHYATVSGPPRDVDQLSIKSDMEGSPGSAFSRGGRLRSSLPIVRSPNKSLDRPLGLVFLIFRNETKRALLPNEITSLDTVRALFVRAFPDHLSMPWFDGAGRRIYAMDPGTNVYYELEDMRDVKDRAVLKIYETDGVGGGGRSPIGSPKLRQAYQPPGYESDSSVRSAPAAGLPRSPVHLPPRPFSQEVAAKTASLPVQPNYLYQQPQPLYGHHKVPGQPWGSPTTSRPHSQYNPSIQGSPVRSPSHGTSQRHSVAYLPRTSELYPQLENPANSGSRYYDYPDTRSSGSVTPTMESVEQRQRMEKMEAQLANLTSLVQTAVMTKDGVPSRPSSARSNTSLVSDPMSSNKSRLARVRTNCEECIDMLETYLGREASTADPSAPAPAPSSQLSMDQIMEEQPLYKGMSDLSSATPQPIITVEMHRSLLTLRHRARELRAEATHIRRAQVANNEQMKDMVHETFIKIKNVLECVPSANDQPVRFQRQVVSKDVKTYRTDSARVMQDLSDLEAAVEELRNDVVSKKCRVNQGEVETMALTLSTISKNLAEMKSKFPTLQDSLKSVMAGEMEIVVQEERYIKEQPGNLESALKKCKKLTGTLFTLKRLASVQESRPPSIPQLPVADNTPDKRAVLDTIQALVPDHSARLTSIEAAENSRERKKKISTNAETLRAEKTLQLAQKQLKETNNLANAELRQETARQQLYDNGNNNVDPMESNAQVNIPLTDTTKRLSIVSQSLGEDNVIKKDSPKSPTKKVPGQIPSPQSPVKSPPPTPPAKPPRTYEAEAPVDNPAPLVDSVVVISSPVVVSQPASVNQSSETTAAPCLSTFAALPTTSAESCATSMPLPPTPVRPGPRPPMTLATSTPKTSTHVSFSATVTEIPDALSPASTSSDSSSNSAGKPKKIPPPPPPRKSSSRTTALKIRSASPPAYENVESLRQKAEDKIKENRAESPKGFRPLSKYQQELASGIYSNMNRPDLQEQNARADKIVRSPEHTAKHRPMDLGKDGSDTDSSTSAEIVQISATVRRRTTPTSSKESSPSPQLNNKDVRKVPPPPPVRKTSALTAEANGNVVKMGNGDIMKVGNGDVIKVGNGDVMNNKLITKKVDVRSLSPASLRKYEETEIY